MTIPNITKPLLVLIVFFAVLCTWKVTPYQLYGDSTYEAVLEHAYVQDWQFGKDIVYTSGPLSFLSSIHSTGETIWLKAIWNVFRSLLLTFLLFRVTRHLNVLASFLFIAGAMVLVLPNVHFVDRKDIFILGVGGYFLLANRTNHISFVAALLSYAAIASHTKFINFLLVGTLCVLILATGLNQKKFKAALLSVLYLGIAYLAVYALAGQDFQYIVSYLMTSFEAASGYTEAMSLNSDQHLFTLLGVALGGACMLMILYQFRRSFTVRGSLISLWLCALLFVSWKHGFGRDDAAHRISFFTAVFWLFWLTILMQSQDHVKFKGPAIICVILSLLAIFGGYADTKGHFKDYLNYWVVKLPTRAMHMWPPKARANLAERQQKIYEESDLGALQDIVGSRSVDFYGSDQGVALMAGLNYTPRPVFQTMAVYTPGLERLNRDFYERSDSPDHIVISYDPVDLRYATMGDSGMLLTALSKYDLTQFCSAGAVDSKNIFLIFTKRKFPRLVSMELLESGRVNAGSYFDFSKFNNEILWLEMEHQVDAFYQFRKLLWKPKNIYMDVHLEGHIPTFRWVPGMASNGFLVNPLLVTNNLLYNYVNYGDQRIISGVNLHHGDYAESINTSLDFKYNLYRVNGLSVAEGKSR